MREISTNTIRDTVAKLCIEANLYLSADIKEGLTNSLESEKSTQGKAVLKDLIDNINIAADRSIPICQDTGMAVVFVELGQDVHIVGGILNQAINDGVAKGYTEGYLRASVVEDPINRKNTKDNTPAVIHLNLVPGDKINITVAPKGFGSENMSAMKMLNPSDGIDGVKDFVIETVSNAGPNPCPPIIVGVGIGGTIEMAALLAKKALLRDINLSNSKPHIAKLEEDLLIKINNLGIGPGGLGGVNTALGVNIDTYPTHIAGLPVVVNMSCHATRHKSITI